MTLSERKREASRILVVDDHANVSKLVEAYISKANFVNVQVEHASSLEIALIKIGQKKFDLILLDNLLPPNFDFRFSVEELKTIFSGPIVLFSGEIPENFGSDFIDSSLAATMTKDDISTKEFVTLLRKFLN